MLLLPQLLAVVGCVGGMERTSQSNITHQTQRVLLSLQVALANNMVNVFQCFLSKSLDSAGSDTEIFIDRITTLTGETIETADFATFGRGILTINPDADGDTTFVEYASFTGVDSAEPSLTGAIRGL